jgi:hypothetical protein
MTPAQIIHDIEALPPIEQAEVIRFACRLEAERQLTGGELTALVERLVGSSDATEAASLRAAISRGFYGGKAHA